MSLPLKWAVRMGPFMSKKWVPHRARAIEGQLAENVENEVGAVDRVHHKESKNSPLSKLESR